MNLRKTFKLITLLQDRSTSYQELAEFLFDETPPKDHNFLARTDSAAVAEHIVSRSYGGVFDFKENPNPQARIAFIIRYPFQYYTYKNIYAHLPESELVIEGTYMKSEMDNGFPLLKILSSFLQKEGAHYRIFSSWESAEEFFRPYDTLVAYMYINLLSLPSNIAKKKVRVMYGHAKDLYNFGAWLRHFDLALTYGPYSNKMIGFWTRAEIVGNPRFDDWFSGKITQKVVEPICRRLDPDKKTILYMPTHHTLSSLDFLAPILGALLQDYNLIIKPHPATLVTEQGRLDEFKAKLAKSYGVSSIFWADDFIDNTHLLFVADVVISDNSGSIFDAILADKPVVLIDALPDDFLEKGNWEIKKLGRNSWSLPGLYRDSIDQRIKREPNLQPGEIIKEAEELTAAIGRALQDDPKYRRARKKLRTMLFSHCDGSSGRKAAELIRDLLKEPTREKSFLQLAVDAEKIRDRTISEKRISSLKKTVASYINLEPYWKSFGGSDEIIFSVVIPAYNGGERITETLNSLIQQRGIPIDQYEIIVVDDGSKDNTLEVVENFIHVHGHIKICYIRSGVNRGPAYARNIGIKMARGTYVAFTDDDCLVPENWLAIFYSAFQENPEIAGVGGWYSTEGNQNHSIFDSFISFCNFPHVRLTGKYTLRFANAFGNTANMCCRKDVLLQIGGFNHFFRYPGFEDFELRDRMYKYRFSLLAHPLVVGHRKRHNFSSFFRYSMILGWGRTLAFVSYRATPAVYYKVTIVNAIFLIVQHWRSIITNYDGVSNFGRRQRFSFLWINAWYYLAMWLGKYWIPLEIIARRGDRQRSVNNA